MNCTTNEKLDIPAVPHSAPKDEELFSVDGQVNLELLKSHFILEGKLKMKQIIEILDKGISLLEAEPNLLELDAPMTSKFRKKTISNV